MDGETKSITIVAVVFLLVCFAGCLGESHYKFRMKALELEAAKAGITLKESK